MHINFGDMEQLRDLMDNSEDYPGMIMGYNEDGEFMTASILCNRIIVDTIQHNNWVRRNIIYHDGSREELYKKDGFDD